jgi:hypothetical protein
LKCPPGMVRGRNAFGFDVWFVFEFWFSQHKSWRP